MKLQYQNGAHGYTGNALPIDVQLPSRSETQASDAYTRSQARMKLFLEITSTTQVPDPHATQSPAGPTALIGLPAASSSKPGTPATQDWMVSASFIELFSLSWPVLGFWSDDARFKGQTWRLHSFAGNTGGRPDVCIHDEGPFTQAYGHLIRCLITAQSTIRERERERDRQSV